MRGWCGCGYFGYCGWPVVPFFSFLDRRLRWGLGLNRRFVLPLAHEVAEQLGLLQEEIKPKTSGNQEKQVGQVRKTFSGFLTFPAPGLVLRCHLRCCYPRPLPSWRWSLFFDKSLFTLENDQVKNIMCGFTPIQLYTILYFIILYRIVRRSDFGLFVQYHRQFSNNIDS